MYVRNQVDCDCCGQPIQYLSDGVVEWEEQPTYYVPIRSDLLEAIYPYKKYRRVAAFTPKQREVTTNFYQNLKIYERYYKHSENLEGEFVYEGPEPPMFDVIEGFQIRHKECPSNLYNKEV